MTSSNLHEKYSNYRYCIVRECKNTSIKTPGKLWIRVPSEINIRKTWLRLAQRDPESLSTVTQIYFCEDHFDLENDMENYTQYKIMGSVKRIRIKSGCVPSRFESQGDKKRKHSPTPDQREIGYQKILITPTSEHSKPVCPIEISTSSFHLELLQEDIIPSCSSSLQAVQHNTQFRDQAVQVQPIHKDASCQVIQHYAHKVSQACVSKHYSSKTVQFSAAVKDAVSSPIQLIAHQSTATSPNKLSAGKHFKPSISGKTISRRKLIFIEEKYDSDASYNLSQGGSSIECTLLKPSSQTTVDSLQEMVVKDENLNLHSTLSKIKQNPRLYIGIPSELYMIVAIISKHTKLSEKHILLCLMKIRLNRTFSQLADDFDISLSQASKINCIIDCLEIEIQKPKKAIYQALTWSKYKKANTFKYLIACTPDGLVSFVSTGYAGRISDINLLENSKFLNSLEPNYIYLHFSR